MKFKPFKAFKALFSIDEKEKEQNFPADFEIFHINIIKKVRPFTMTSDERLFSLIESVKYIINNDIIGDFVECGVWKGGSMMAIAETLLQLGVSDRNLYLFDTYEGMTEPTNHDIDVSGFTAKELLQKDLKKKDSSVIWAYSSLDEVKSNMSRINYPASKINFIKGDVLNTIPCDSIKKIALLRLDTDWYASTKHELDYLYPLLEDKGILIIDDYGCWAGSKKAVDEYFVNTKNKKMLTRIDNTGRILIK